MSEGTQHGWSKLVGLVGSHAQEEACARSEAAKGVCVSAGRNVCGQRSQNAEVDNDATEVVSVLSCLPTPDSPAPDDPLTNTGCMCAPCEQTFRYANSKHISPKKGNTCYNSAPMVKSSGIL